MDIQTNPNRQTEIEKYVLKDKVIPGVMLVLAVASIVGIYIFYGRYPEKLDDLKSYTYGGAFLISLIGNATILLPGVVLAILTNMGIVLYSTTGIIGPILIGVAGGIGASMGETTGYLAGYSGRVLVLGQKKFERVQSWMKKWGSLSILLLSIVPFIFDLIGIAAGSLRFPLWKFILLCGLGRIILYVGLIILVSLGWQAVSPYFD